MTTPTAPQERSLTLAGGVARAWACRDPEVLVDGPAGTGKSFGLLSKLHAAALRYPGMRGLICRRWYSTLRQAAVVTWERGITPRTYGAIKHATAQEYRYPNGSVVVLAGMDRPEKIMSTEYDLIYVQEAVDLTEDQWEALSTRARNAVMPYQQLIADCNPGPDNHWLKQRWERGVTTRFQSHHQDNPALWDAAAQTWTQRGEEYLARLGTLSGVRLLRLRDGLWCSSEGMIYQDVWRSDVHIIDRFRLPVEWPRYISVDFGYTHPFVAQWWAVDGDGRMYRYREIYHTQHLVEDEARHIKYFINEDAVKPRAIICDHDAEDRATLERHVGMATLPAIKAVSPGIQAVAARMRPAGDGKPRLYLFRNSLVNQDRDLRDRHLPTCMEEEVESYVWDGGRGKDEKPLKEYDHAMDTCRYMVAYLDHIGQARRTGGGGASAGERPAIAGYVAR